MMTIENHLDTLAEPVAQELIDQILPGGTVSSIHVVTGDFYNRLFYLDAHSAAGKEQHYVVKLYQGNRDYGIQQSRVEYQALCWLYQHGRPVPEPLFLDDSGQVLGGPGVVTRFMPGSPLVAPPYPANWGRQMALTLASIHAYPYDASLQSFLLDANHTALWFRKSGSIPNWLSAYPDGLLIWETIEFLLASTEKTPPKLINLDFWSGNVLCVEERIVTVLDWGEAGYGDPGIDVAYCLMDFVLSGLDQPAIEFLSAYTSSAGPVANLALWKLAAAVRPIYLPEGWIDHSPVRERFRSFVQEAVEEAKKQ
jgi:aminoglycoside phosphotransferase (APT) family kinase protein